MEGKEGGTGTGSVRMTEENACQDYRIKVVRYDGIITAMARYGVFGNG